MKKIVYLSILFVGLGIAGFLVPTISLGTSEINSDALEDIPLREASELQMDNLKSRLNLSTLPEPEVSIPDAPVVDPLSALNQWQLIGITKADDRYIAMFTSRFGTRLLRTGEALEGFRISSIYPQSVTLQQRSTIKQFHLLK